MYFKRVILIAVLLTVTAGLFMAGQVSAEAPDSVTAQAQEWELLTLINADRIANGMPALKMQPDIQNYARVHAKDMRNQGRIWHDMPAYEGWLPAGWSSHGENVGLHNGIAAVHRAFMNSAGHRANVLNTDFNYVGLGVAAGNDGRLYVSENFMKHPGTLPVVNPGGALMGDVNGDSRINALDLSSLIGNDGKAFAAADFNKDGTVGAADMAILLSRWTW